jgi:POT family proton-dependent oligopeptide transporter
LFSQMDTSWILQAKSMDRIIHVPEFLHKQINWIPAQFELLPAQIIAANPLMIMILIPIFSFVIYPAMNKLFNLTPLRKISIGLFVAALTYVISAWIETRITDGQTPSVWWLVLACLVITAAEVMVSITVLEFSYTQAPKEMKSFIMAISSLSIFLGNLFAAGVNFFIYNDDGTSKLEGASYFWFFAGAMFLTAVVFIPFAACYKEHTFISDEVSKEE